MDEDKQFEASFSCSIQPDECPTEGSVKEEMACVLENIASQIRDGYTSGHSPSWDLEIKEIN